MYILILACYSIICFIMVFIYKNNIIKNFQNMIIILIMGCFLITISFNSGLYFIEYDGTSSLRIPFWFITYIAITISFVLLNIIMKTKNDNNEGLIKICLILILINVLSWWSFSNDKVKYFNFIYLYFGIMCLYIIISNFNKFKIEYILDIINIIAIINGILSVFQYVLNKKLLIGAWNDDILFLDGTNAVVKRVVGLVGTNNAAGNFGAILFTVVLYNFIKKKRLIDFIALACTSVFSILTLTRIGYLSIGIVIVIFFIFTTWRNYKTFLKKYIFVVVTIVLLGVIIINFGQSIYDTLFVKRGPTSDYRETQFESVMENVYINNWLLGVGPGQMNRYILKNYSYYEIDLHSQYLNVLVEQGLLIFIIYVVFNFSILIKLYKKYRNNELIKCLILSMFISFLICSNYNPNQYYLTNNMIYYIIMFSLLFYKYVNEDEVNNIRIITCNKIKKIDKQSKID